MAIETLTSLVQAATGMGIRADASYPLSSGTQGTELYEILTGGAVGAAGPAVTERTAMMVSAWYAGLQLISGSVLQLPCHIYERNSSGNRQKADHDYRWLLNESPNPRMSAGVMWQYVMVALKAHGDAFAELKIDRRGRVASIEPLHPNGVEVEAAEVGGPLSYLVYDGVGSGWRRVDADRMIHVPGLGFDGKRGMSVLKYAAREALATALAAQNYSSRYFSNGARPDMALKTPEWLTKEQQAEILEAWSRMHGYGREHRPAILQGGLDIKELANTAEAAQLLGARGYQVEDVARFLGVPAFMLGHTEKQTSWGTGAAEQGVNYVKYTLNPDLVKVQQELNRKLFPRSERYFCEFLTAGLERGDLKGRNESYRAALGGSNGPGYMTPNEVRRLENLAPLDDPEADRLVKWSKSNEKPASEANPE